MDEEKLLLRYGADLSGLADGIVDKLWRFYIYTFVFGIANFYHQSHQANFSIDSIDRK
ncbi:MAG: hypothetical protein IPL23_24455 [Saprospiraceae bacterium]|nr:hypothetical protein [Saprospiraceae bacterium]